MPTIPQPELKPLPFEEAIKFFGDKVLLTSKEYYALSEESRARAFTVARVAKMDILEGIYESVDSAIKDGETLKDFQANIDGLADVSGWVGLEAHHSELVFRNNIQTSYGAGRFTQLDKVKEKFYAEYNAIDDSRVRETHFWHNGKIYAVDHPFWDQWTPPNGHA